MIIDKYKDYYILKYCLILNNFKMMYSATRIPFRNMSLAVEYCHGHQRDEKSTGTIHSSIYHAKDYKK